jgi:hypothetical protein
VRIGRVQAFIATATAVVAEGAAEKTEIDRQLRCPVGVSALLNEWMRAAQATDPVWTARLHLTPVGAEDVEDLVLLCSDPLVAFWTGPWSRATIKAWAEGMTVRWADDGVGKWLARDRSDETLVGRGGFTRIELNGGGCIGIGLGCPRCFDRSGLCIRDRACGCAVAAVFIPHLPMVAFSEVHNTRHRR